MVRMPHEASGKLRKLALPYHGPYRVLDVTPNDVSVRPVDRPDEEPIFVNLERVTRCPDALPDVSWLGPRTRRRRRQSCKRSEDTPPETPHTYGLRSCGPAVEGN